MNSIIISILIKAILVLIVGFTVFLVIRDYIKTKEKNKKMKQTISRLETDLEAQMKNAEILAEQVQKLTDNDLRVSGLRTRLKEVQTNEDVKNIAKSVLNARRNRVLHITGT